LEARRGDAQGLGFVLFSLAFSGFEGFNFDIVGTLALRRFSLLSRLLAGPNRQIVI
jgi:hypothetical protein